MHNGNESLAHEKLTLLQSYNSIPGIDSILKIYAKDTKIGTETPLHLDTPFKTAEGSVEPHPQDMVEESLPLASVNSDFPDSP